MIDRRRAERKIPEMGLQLIDEVTGEPLGTILDLNVHGCRIFSKEDFEVGEKCRTHVVLPEPIVQVSDLILPAECCWVGIRNGDGFAEVGLKFFDLPPRERLVLGFLTVPWNVQSESKRETKTS